MSCDCEPNYTGARCDVLIDACFDVQCFDGATCVTCDDCMKGYTCLCEEGFAGKNFIAGCLFILSLNSNSTFIAFNLCLKYRL